MIISLYPVALPAICYRLVINYRSAARPMLEGIPQGSVLGALLFLYFINDLPNLLNNFMAVLYADDTTLSYSWSTFD